MKVQTFQMNINEFEVKAGKIKIKGKASTPQVDRYNDVVKPEAFMGTMEAYMTNPVVLLQHDTDKPIGKVIAYKILSDGLEVEAEISNDIDNCMKLITDGILRTFSIGFFVKKWGFIMQDDKEIREISEIDLVEISVVTTPANPGAIFSLAKSIKQFFTEIKEAEAIAATAQVEPIQSQVEQALIAPVEPAIELATPAPIEVPVAEIPQEVPAPIMSQEPTGETVGVTPTTTVPEPPKEEPKAEMPDPSIVIWELNARIEELTKLNEELAAQNATLKTESTEKQKSIDELSQKSLALEEKIWREGVRKWKIVTSSTKSFGSILTYSHLLHNVKI
jgi:HK97 family phage prohead protease